VRKAACPLAHEKRPGRAGRLSSQHWPAARICGVQSPGLPAGGVARGAGCATGGGDTERMAGGGVGAVGRAMGGTGRICCCGGGAGWAGRIIGGIGRAMGETGLGCG
jgi:hypothetical protein